jgi:hypothetical protein
MKKIKLEKILKEKSCHIDDFYDAVVAAMREACKQTLELAAENVEVEFHYQYRDSETIIECAFVNKQSILDVINLIE